MTGVASSEARPVRRVRRGPVAAAAVVACLAVVAGCSQPPKHVTLPEHSRSASPSGSTSTDSSGPAPSSGGDDFRSVAVGAGGFVTGMSMSDDGSTRVVRTDGFGGYRWDAQQNQWVLNVSADSLPASDVSPGLGGGVLETAVAPSDGSRAYLAYDDHLYRSDDGAKTWTSVLADVETSPGAANLATGPRIVVDPTDPDVVYYGSQTQGLYLSRDGGSSWTQVPASAVPSGQTPPAKSDQPTDKADKSKTSPGVNVLAIDRSGGTTADGRSKVVYAASYGNGVYRSTDGGDTWSQIGDAKFAVVLHMVVLDDGDVLLISRSDLADTKGPVDVWRYHDGQWSASGPDGEGKWSALAADPADQGQVALMAQGGKLSLSEDDGVTWTSGRPHPELRRRRALARVGAERWHRLHDRGRPRVRPRQGRAAVVHRGHRGLVHRPGRRLEDPGQRELEQPGPRDRAAGPHQRHRPTRWRARDGFLGPGDLPVRGPHHLSLHLRTGQPVQRGLVLDWSVSDPSYLVADVASQQEPSDPTTSGYSTDGGKTWTPFPTIPLGSTNAVTTFGFGSMAVSDPGNVVWVPAYGRRPMYTQDGGKTWTPITLPGVTDYAKVDNQAYYVNRQVIAADKATAGTFYLFVDKSGLFRSTDGGDTWTQMSDTSALPNSDYGYNVTLKAMPGREGELFLTPGKLGGPADAPFLHSTDGGKTWDALAGVTSVTAFGFGAAMSGSDQPTVFIAGDVDGAYGVYRSDDDGQTWTLLTTYPAGRTPNIAAIDGDKQVPGRVYLAVNGSGWVYGS